MGSLLVLAVLLIGVLHLISAAVYIPDAPLPPSLLPSLPHPSLSPSLPPSPPPPPQDELPNSGSGDGSVVFFRADNLGDDAFPPLGEEGGKEGGVAAAGGEDPDVTEDEVRRERRKGGREGGREEGKESDNGFNERGRLHK